MSDLSAPTSRTIAILGGTGKEGRGLAYRWAKAGMRIIIGSRVAERADAAAREVAMRVGGGPALTGTTNEEAAAQADVVVITVPYAAHRSTLEAVRSLLPGKLLVDVTVPLVPPKVGTVHMPPDGSAAQEARKIVGETVAVTAAFQNISHEHLLGDSDVDCEVLVTGTSKEARAAILALVEAAGLRGWDAGAIENSAVVEGLTSVLIHINRRYGSTHAGIRITGIPSDT